MNGKLIAAMGASLAFLMSCGQTGAVIDPIVEGLVCADISSIWRKKVGLSEDAEGTYFRSCSIGYENHRVARVHITAITESMPARKGIECESLIQAAQSVAEDNNIYVRAFVSDFDEDHYLYSEALCVFDGIAFR